MGFLLIWKCLEFDEMETERAVVEDKLAAGKLLHGEVLLKAAEAKGLETVGRCQQGVAVSAVIDSRVEDLEMTVGMVELKDVSGAIVYVVEHHDFALNSHEQALVMEVFLSAGGQCVDGGEFPIAVEFPIVGGFHEITAGSKEKYDGDQREEYLEMFCHISVFLYTLIYIYNMSVRWRRLSLQVEDAGL